MDVDVALIERSWSGAPAVPAAFERLFRAEYARVARVAYRVLGGQAEAEDVAQDVFIAFYRDHPADAPYAATRLPRAVETEAGLARFASAVQRAGARPGPRAMPALLLARPAKWLAAAAGIVIVASALTLSCLADSIRHIFEAKQFAAVTVTPTDLH